MPLLEFRCAAGHHFETIGVVGNKLVGTCPICGSETDQRMVSAPAPHRVYAENPASPDNWRRHQEASQDVRDIGRRRAVEQNIEVGSLVPRPLAAAIRSSRRRFETPDGTGPHEGGQR